MEGDGYSWWFDLKLDTGAKCECSSRDPFLGLVVDNSRVEGLLIISCDGGLFSFIQGDSL